MSLSGRAAELRHRSAVLRRWLAQRILLPDLADDDAAALREQVLEEGSLTSGYVLMCCLSAGIATLGLLQSSPAVVIGAMLVSPLMSPIASLGFGFASFDGEWIRKAARVVVVGAAIGIATGLLITLVSPISNATPEIIARTQPTLLDLAVALLSGIAGGYATVRQKGGTAIGVAIATALMPPLATAGYGLGAGRLDFAGGAFLLFLTNLAAIAFSFALIARLSGTARPLAAVSIAPRHIVAGTLAFLALASPLAMTLYRVAHETNARNIARNAIGTDLDVAGGGIAQLDVKWPLFEPPSVDAILIVPEFREDAANVLRDRLRAALGAEPDVHLQQIVAADGDRRTRAIVNSALERTAAGIARDVPPFAEIRKAMGIPIQSLWIDRPSRVVHIVPHVAEGWTMRDYRRAEAAANRNGGGWTTQLSPPALASFDLAFDDGAGLDAASARVLDDAVWAMQRWSAERVIVRQPPAEEADAALAAARLERVAAALLAAGLQPVALDDEAVPQATLSIAPAFDPPSDQVDR